MMEWTDRHCRYFYRLMTKRALLYTEMVVADAILHGDRDYLLGFNESEHPVALQLGGSDPAKLAQAARIGEDFGYDEINLNVGCPSDRVQSGTFGACLMLEPELVGRCVAAMKEVCFVPVTVKCRLGVDEQDIESALDALAIEVWNAGCDRLWVHARKAWLQGLSPKENREIPPLDYERVYRLKSDYASHFIGINGGVESLIQAEEHLRMIDGVMIGRAAYRSPSLLRQVDQQIFDFDGPEISWEHLIDEMCAYVDKHIARGGRLHQVTRHMLGLFQGCPGSRRFRQILSSEATKPGAGPEVLQTAFREVDIRGVSDAA